MSKRLKITVAACVLALVSAAVLLPIGLTYGWFRGEKKIEPPASSTGGIELNVAVTFGDLTPEQSKNYISNGFVSVDVLDETQPNHMSKLKVSVSYKAKLDFVLRVKVQHVWMLVTRDPNNSAFVLSTQYIRNDNLKLNLVNDRFFDNVANDGAYYYYDLAKTGAAAYTLPADAPVENASFLDGVTAEQQAVYPEKTELRLSIRIEAVQAERFREKWKLTEYPTPPTPPA